MTTKSIEIKRLENSLRSALEIKIQEFFSKLIESFKNISLLDNQSVFEVNNTIAFQLFETLAKEEAIQTLFRELYSSQNIDYNKELLEKAIGGYIRSIFPIKGPNFIQASEINRLEKYRKSALDQVQVVLSYGTNQ